MDLKRALQRVSVFAAPASKDPSAPIPNSYVVVVPARFDPCAPLFFMDDLPVPVSPAYVAAWDGVTSSMIHLDPDVHVPHVSIAAAPLRKALASIKGPFAIHRVAHDTVVLTEDNGAQHALPCMDPHGVTLVRPRASIPLELPDLAGILRVRHAASEDPARLELTFLHLAPGYVQATDEVSVARADVRAPLVAHPMLVGVDLFQKWHADDSTWAVHGEYVVVTTGEEQRSAKWLPAEKYFDLDPLLERKDHGFSVDMHADTVGPAVKAAAKAAPDTDCVELAFSSGSCEVRGMAADGTTTYSQIVTALGADQPVRVCLRGKPLVAALTALGQGAFRATYAPSQPFRMEMAGYQELIWPLGPAEVVDADD